MTTKINRICDVCAGTSFELICSEDRRRRPLDTVMCTRCGLVGHAAVPTEQELAEYYASHYREDYHGEQQPSSRRVWRAWLKGERVLRELQPHLRPASRVFEVGAGLGCTVKVFDLAGHDASGLEPGLEFQRYSAEQLRAQVFRGNLRDYKPQAPFDMVLFIHVIEHLPSPRLALQAIHRLLKPSGKLYFECPSLGKKCTRLSDQFHYAHIHTFTPIPLLTLFKQCGFAVERCISNGVGLNHKFLLAKTTPVDCPIDPAGVDQTRAFAATYADPWRRLKSLDYFKRRCRRIGIYLKEYLWGDAAVRNILTKVQQQRRLAAAG